MRLTVRRIFVNHFTASITPVVYGINNTGHSRNHGKQDCPVYTAVHHRADKESHYSCYDHNNNRCNRSPRFHIVATSESRNKYGCFDYTMLAREMLPLHRDVARREVPPGVDVCYLL